VAAPITAPTPPPTAAPIPAPCPPPAIAPITAPVPARADRRRLHGRQDCMGLQKRSSSRLGWRRLGWRWSHVFSFVQTLMLERETATARGSSEALWQAPPFSNDAKLVGASKGTYGPCPALNGTRIRDNGG